MIRFLLFFIPVLTFLVPPRFFSFYATLMIAVTVYVVLMLTLLSDSAKEAFAEFGTEMAIAYMTANLILLGVRYFLIRRARERILKLPAPKK